MTITLIEARSVLGLAANATEEESKSAYKRAALASHPDKNKNHDSTAEFQRVSAAYECITKHFHPPKPRNPFQHYQAQSDEDDDDDDEYYYDDDDDEDDSPFGNHGDFYQFMFENIFAGGNGRSGFRGGNRGFGGGNRGFGGGFGRGGFQTFATDDGQIFGFPSGRSPFGGNGFGGPFGGPPPPRPPPESPEDYAARLKREREALAKAQAVREEEERRARETREEAREKEMNAGAARRESKLSAKKQKAAAEKAAAASRALDLLQKAQINRAAVFAAAKRGDASAVKRGIWEDNVDAAGVERLPGYLSPAEAEKAKFDKENAANAVVEEDEVDEESRKENISQNVGVGEEREGGKGKSKKKKKGKGGAGNVNGNGSEAPSSNGSSVPPLSKSTPAPKSTAPPPLKQNGTNGGKAKGPKFAKPKGVDEKETLLHIAVKKGDADLAEWLVDHGSSIEERDSYQFTPVHYALQTGPFALVEFFLSNNPPPKVAPSADSSNVDAYFPCPRGETLLSLAVSSANLKIVELIVGYATPEAATASWKWIEGLTKSGKITDAQKNVWEEMKWLLATVEGFTAPAAYLKRRRVRT